MIALLADHVWQSTLVAAVIGLLILTVCGNRPQVRYRLWLTASMKFLLPLALLVAAGTQIGGRLPGVVLQPELTGALDTMSQPFSAGTGTPRAEPGRADRLPTIRRTASIALVAVWFTGALAILLIWWRRWRRVAAIVRAASPVESGRELETLRRLEHACGRSHPIALVSSNTSLEPGVFGIVAPVLLWPRSISEHLDDRQIEAIIAHELAHVARRDNLAAALHMVVQAVFWFHPLVWWLGRRLVDERERACDADVVRRLDCDPQIYAEGILKTCELYVELPLACVAGIAGSHLKDRIERIMTNHATPQLNFWRRLFLATVGVVAIAGPIAVGVLNAPRLGAQSPAGDARGLAFAVASVKPTSAGAREYYPVATDPDGRFVWNNVHLGQLIRRAYGMPPSQPMVGVPNWFKSDRFDVEARAEGHPTEEQMWSMMRSLLADRFKLRVHNETRDLPVYALVLARSDGTLGARVRPSACVAKDKVSLGPGPLDPSRPGPLPCGGVRSMTLKGTIQARFATMAKLADALGMLVGRPVQDRTGLTGTFDLEVEWPPAPGPPGPGAPGVGPAMLTAIEEQLGLRLDEKTAPVDVLVIDHAEQPAPDKLR
jgi:bla regulator protein BlaR1